MIIVHSDVKILEILAIELTKEHDKVPLDLVQHVAQAYVREQENFFKDYKRYYQAKDF